MTSKDYQLIATTIDAERAKSTNFRDVLALHRVVKALAVELKKQDNNFDADMFCKACGYAA